MSSKLKAKPRKQRLPLAQPNQAAQAFGRAMVNRGEMSVLSMMQDIEKNTDVRFDEMNKNLVKKMGV